MSVRQKARASSTSPPAAARKTSGYRQGPSCPPIAPLDEFGRFLPGFGELSGKSAVDPATTDSIIDNLKQKGVLLEVEKYPHSYPHCWRCKTELLFRLVDEWFIAMSWRDEIKEVVRQSRWMPEIRPGPRDGLADEHGRLDDLQEALLGTGLADLDCTTSRALRGDRLAARNCSSGPSRAGRTFEGHTPHRPWVDPVKIECAKCGELMSRIPDVGNPWLDAGIVPFSTLELPHGQTVLAKMVPGRLHYGELPRPVPQLVLLHAGDEHRAGTAVPASRPAGPRGARRKGRGDAQDEGQLHRRSTRRPTRWAPI